MQKENIPYVVCDINYVTGKVVIMLNFGLNFNSAKIEEYSFGKKRNYEQSVDDSLLVILSNFVQENACRQAQFFVVVDDSCVGSEFLTIPYVSALKNDLFIKTELSRLYNNFEANYSYTSFLINKNKKNSVYKCSLMQKDLINKISLAYKKLGLNLLGITFSSCAFTSIISSNYKIKNNSYFILDVNKNVSRILYMYKNQLMASINFNSKELEQIDAINAGQAFNTDDAIYEIYFFGQSMKENFGVQLDITGEPLNKQKIVDKQRKIWKSANAHLNEKDNAFYPVAKVVNSFNECIKKYGFPESSTLYLTENMQDIKGYDKFATLINMEVKCLDLQKSFNAQICDYLHLFGVINIGKVQPSNVFASKQGVKRLFSLRGA